MILRLSSACPSTLRSLALPSSVLIRSISSSTPAMSKNQDFYNLKAELPGNRTFDFKELEGKVVLIVNTASACGFTPQYKGLEELYKKYKDRGFTVLGFPSNQFGNQEKGNDDEIKSFCELNYGVSFPIMKKSDVNGDNANEVFKYIKSQKTNWGFERVKWNFEKCLADRNGNIVHRYSSVTTPASMESEIERLLAQEGGKL